jgi:hypothetical protein
MRRGKKQAASHSEKPFAAKKVGIAKTKESPKYYPKKIS